eukprot:g32958.t1
MNRSTILLAIAAVFLFANSTFAQKKAQPNPNNARRIQLVPGSIILGGSSARNPLFLLRSPAVQKELKIDSDQKTELNEAIQELTKKRRDAFSKVDRTLPVQQRLQKNRELTQKLNKESAAKVKSILEPKQIERLDQIMLQMQGIQALLTAPVQKKLNITGDQKTKLQQVQVAANNARMKYLQDARANGRIDLKKYREANKKMNEKREQDTYAVLTKEQRAAFDKLKGRKFEIPRGNFHQRAFRHGLADDAENLCLLVGGALIGPGEHDQIGAAQAGKGFTKQPARQQPAVTERIERVDQDDVEIAGQSAVLETVVENEHLGIEFVGRVVRRADAIGVLQMRHAGAEVLEHPFFVVARRAGGVSFRVILIAGTGGLTPTARFERSVAAAEQRDVDVAREKPFRQKRDHRRFAGSACRDVADADDGNRRGVGFLPAEIKRPVPGAHADAVKHRQRAQPGALRSGNEAAALSRDQLVKCGFVHVIRLPSAGRRPAARRCHSAAIFAQIAAAISWVPTAVVPLELRPVGERDGTGFVVPQAVGVLHDVGLADRRDRFAILLDGVIERVVADATQGTGTVPKLTLAGLALVTAMCSTVVADDFHKQSQSNWHQWRGPNADGVAPNSDPPVEWDENTNIKWKAPLPGRGSSTPIIWGKKVFLLTAVKTDRVDATKPDPKKQPKRPFGITYPNAFYQFIVMCLDRDTGKVLWKKVAREAVPPEGRHGDNNYASSSPTTDGKYVYASFGSNGIYCYDVDGNKIWERDLGDMKTRLSFGGGSSPVIHGDSLVIAWDHDGPSFLTVLDAKTGKTKWKKDRNEVSAWATPVVVEHKGRTQVIANAKRRVTSYDIETGDIIWECGGQVSNVTPSPVVKDGVVYCMSGYRGSAAYAIPLDSKGDITNTDKIAWKIQRNTPYISSPLLYGDELYFGKSLLGVISSYDAKTGKQRFGPTRLPNVGRLYASPIGAGNRIYVQSRDGRTIVLKRGDTFKVLAENKLNDKTDASPAAVGNQLFIRGTKSLYCIEAAK